MRPLRRRPTAALRPLRRRPTAALRPLRRRPTAALRPLRRRPTAALLALGTTLLAACSTAIVEAGNDAPNKGGFVDVTIVVATTAAADDTSTSSPQAPSRYVEGDCLVWDQALADAEFELVPCSEDHLVEVTSPIDLSAAYPGSAAVPGTDELRALAEDRCTPVAAAYLGRDLRGEEPGIILPSTADWAAGDRASYCTVGLARQGGERPAYTGTLRDR